jgi:hypothetical protein
MERISELGTALAVTSNRSTLRRNTNYMKRISELGTALAVTSKLLVVPSSLILSTFMMVPTRYSETLVLTEATRHHVPENGILHSHRRENPKPSTN